MRGGKLCHNADIARAKLRSVRLLFALYVHQLAHTLGLARAAVHHRRIGLQRTADYLYIAHLAHKRIGHGFKDIRAQRFGGIARDLHRIAVAVFPCTARGLRRAGQQLLDAVHHHARAHKRRRAAAHHGRDGAGLYARTHAVDQLLACERLALEEFFHQSVVCFGHGLAHGLDKAVFPVAVLGQRYLAARIAREAVGLIFDHIYKDAAAGLLHRHYNRAYGRAECRLQLFKHLIEIGMLRIDFGNVDHPAFVLFQRQLVCLLRAHCQAAARGYGDQHALGGLNALVHPQLKIKQARRVQQIDLHTLMLDGRHGQRKRRAASGLLGIEVAHGVPVLHTAQSVGALCSVHHCFNKTGLARAAVPCNEYVSDVIACVIHTTTLFSVAQKTRNSNLYKNGTPIIPLLLEKVTRKAPPGVPNLARKDCTV